MIDMNLIMACGRNPKEAVDDPEPIVDRDPNDGLIDQTDPKFGEWVEWHLSKPLTQDFIDGLRRKLEDYGDEAGLRELAGLERPTRFDHRRLLNIAEAKFRSPSNLTGLEF
jgi:hypothetical protein